MQKRASIFSLLLLTSLSAAEPMFTNDAALGAGAWSFSGQTIKALGGPSFGVGQFVTPDIAVGPRLAGATLIDDGGAYLGVFCLHAQGWVTDHAWVGGGAGVGMAFAFDANSEFHSGLGLDARLGYAFKAKGTDGLNLSVEMTTLDRDIKTYSLLLGYQSF